MHSFLGLCNYYWKLIPHFADLSSPWYALTSQNKLEKSTELLNAFDALKTAMCSTAALGIPDSTLPFILETDASNVALRAVLRPGTPGDSYPVAFFSIGLSKPERNYSTYER